MYQFLISILILSIPLMVKAQTWDFAVSMNGKPIGTHQFILTDAENNQKVLKSEAKFNIKILSINFFSTIIKRMNFGTRDDFGQRPKYQSGTLQN